MSEQTGTSNPDQLIGTAGADVLSGLDGDDLLRGNDGEDTLLGGVGNDGLWGGRGNDLLDGSSGISDGADYMDVFEVAPATRGVILNLSAAPIIVGDETIAANTAIDAWGGRDTLVGIERANGSSRGDFLVGGNGSDGLNGHGGDDTLLGGAGNDWLRGGSGNDLIDGGEGTSDTADYGGYDTDGAGSRGIVVNLSAAPLSTGGATVEAGTAIDERGHRDTLSGIENLFGSSRDDIIVGNAEANNLDGQGGDDTLIGGGGSDFLQGGAGNDRLEGEAGNDALNGGLGDDTLIGGVGYDRLALRDLTIGFSATITGEAGTITGAELGTDQIFGIDELDGGSGDDLLQITSVIPNGFSFRGNAGADTLIGSEVPDRLLNAAYETSPTGIIADLRLGQVQDGFGFIDQLVHVYRVTGSAHADQFFGTAAAEVFSGRGGADTIDGGGGQDGVQYHHSPSGVVVNLAAGTAQDGYGTTDVLISIEEVSGSNHADTLIGTAGSNWLTPNAGDDLVRGQGGTDTVGYGSWSPAGLDAFRGIHVSLLTGRVVDPWGGSDTLEGIENVQGSQFGDTIIGDAFANEIRPGAGSDFIIGGAGADRVNYTDSAGPIVTVTGVVIDLALGTAVDPWGGIDTLEGIERITGTAFADHMTGDARSNRFNGRAGADIILGGAGSDWAEYGNATSGVTANLTIGIANDGEGGIDTLRGIEHLIGSGFADDLTGASGNPGISQLRGGRGNDTLRAGDNGAAVANFADQGEAMLVDLSSGLVTSITLGTDRLIGIRGAAMFGDFADTLIGTSGDDWLSPDRGGDVVQGGAGFDVLVYWDATSGIVADLGTGRVRDHGGAEDSIAGIEALQLVWTDDIVRGSAGNDVIDPGVGADTIDAMGGHDLLDYGLGYGPTSAFFGADAAGSQAAIQGALVDLTLGIAIDIGGFLDRIAGFEDVGGNNGADTLLGSADANLLFGRAGDDVLEGRDGADTLQGGVGADTLDGGAGHDVAVYSGVQAGYAITNLGGGLTRVESLAAGVQDGTDIIIRIETLRFVDGDVQISGSQAILSITPEIGDRAEGSGSGVSVYTFLVNRTGDLSGASQASWTVTGSGVRAANAADFLGNALPSGTVSFASGEAMQTVKVRVQRDATAESDESFTVSLGTVAGGSLGTANATGTIRDDDAPRAVLSITPEVSDRAEGSGSGVSVYTFLVNRTGDLSGASQASWTVAGSSAQAANAADFLGGVLPSGTVSFAAGETVQTLKVRVQRDAAVEADEGFTVSLGSTSGASLGTANATGTIRDDDAPRAVLSIAPEVSDRAEGTGNGVSVYTFLVNRTGDVSGASQASWTVAGSGAHAANAADFLGNVLPSGTVSFAAGETVQTLKVRVQRDAAAEADEGFTVNLGVASGASLGTARATGTIRDDDAPRAVLSITPEIGDRAEGTGSGVSVFTFLVNRTGDLSGASQASWSVAGSGAQAANAADFLGGVLPSGTVSFAAGEAVQTVKVRVVRDVMAEADEGFTVNFGVATGASLDIASASGTIRDDDVLAASRVALADLDLFG